MPQTTASNRSANATRSPSNLVRHLSELEALQPGEWWECPHCQAEFDKHVGLQLDLSEREDVICGCGNSGFILHVSHRKQTVKEKRPMLSGQFYASAVELRVYGRRLGLDVVDRAVIETIDQFPEGWDMTREAIANAADCTLAQVKRSLQKLQGYRGKDAEPGRALISVERRYFNGRRTGTIYDLTPLWNALAEEARKDVEPPEVVVSTVTTARMEPETTAPYEPIPLEVQALKRTLSCERARNSAGALFRRLCSHRQH